MGAIKPYTPEELEAIRTRYAAEGATQLASELGRSRKAISLIANRRLGISLDENTLRERNRRWAVEYHQRTTPAEKEAMRAHMSDKMKEIIRRDRIQVRHGLPQLTRLTITERSPRKSARASHLRARGYWEFEDDRNTMYFDSRTKTHPCRAVGKRDAHGFIFKPISEYHGNFITLGRKTHTPAE